MLWVFMLAILPWGVLHRHAHLHELKVEKNCTHKVHIKNQQENCLVCKAHFEKHYTLITLFSQPVLAEQQQESIFFKESAAFRQLTLRALRGPPAFV